MGDEAGGSSNGSRLGLADVVDMLRSDGAASEARGQRLLDDAERRLMGAIQSVSSDLGHYIEIHGHDHTALRAESAAAHGRFDAFIESSKLVQARKDGALGVTRYLVELVSGNAGALVKVAIAIAGALLAVSGNVHIDIGS